VKEIPICSTISLNICKLQFILHISYVKHNIYNKIVFVLLRKKKEYVQLSSLKAENFARKTILSADNTHLCLYLL